MEFAQKQIWLVNFDPSFGHEYKKVRPALIIEDSKYIETGNLSLTRKSKSRQEEEGGNQGKSANNLLQKEQV